MVCKYFTFLQFMHSRKLNLIQNCASHVHDFQNAKKNVGFSKIFLYLFQARRISNVANQRRKKDKPIELKRKRQFGRNPHRSLPIQILRHFNRIFLNQNFDVIILQRSRSKSSAGGSSFENRKGTCGASMKNRKLK